MSVYRSYSWRFRGHSFSYQKSWPDSYISHLESLPHDIRRPSEYTYYIDNDPYEDELQEFFEEILRLPEGELPDPEEKDVLEYLLSFVQHLKYYEERGEYPRYPSETVMDGGGDCEDTAILMAYIAVQLGYKPVFLDFGDHIDLGIAPNYSGEFHGTYWTEDGERFYFVSCNGKGYGIGEYSGRFGDHARVIAL